MNPDPLDAFLDSIHDSDMRRSAAFALVGAMSGFLTEEQRQEVVEQVAGQLASWYPEKHSASIELRNPATNA